MHLRLLVGHDGPRRRMAGRSYVRDAVSSLSQVLGERAAHVVVVKIEYDNRAVDTRPRTYVIRREHVRLLEIPDRQLERGIQHPGPARAGGNDHPLMLELQDIVDRELVACVESYIWQTLQLAHSPVEDPAPCGEP